MSAQAPAVRDLAFADAVRDGLGKDGQKELPSMYLYDAVGSALFEAITFLPEYGLTRADERLLRKHSREILNRLPGPVALAELGSGTGRKTRWVLEAAARRGPVSYYPIDISAPALERCRLELSGFGGVSICGLEKPYLEGLREAGSLRRAGESLLVLFLGSTIGNFERPAAADFLRAVRGCLRPGDALLLGTDLLKPVPELLLAYDDPAGVTAAFNINLLARVNRELDGDFVLSAFAHQARYDERERRVEMHLLSKRRQRVSVGAANFTCMFQEGETIWTEACHKFDAGEVMTLAGSAGFWPEAQWIDGEWAFAENLWIAR